MAYMRLPTVIAIAIRVFFVELTRRTASHAACILFPVFLLSCQSDPDALLKQHFARKTTAAPLQSSATRDIPKDAVKPLHELGKLLFFDPRLSTSGAISCATCHNPSFHWTDSLKASIENQSLRTMCLYDIGWDKGFTWRNGPGAVAYQTFMALSAPKGMNVDDASLSNTIRSITGYHTLFANAFRYKVDSGPSDRISMLHVGIALEVFVASIRSPVAPFDRWVAGENSALSRSAKKGFQLFTGKARCIRCHSSWRFSDGQFYDIGLKRAPGEIESGSRAFYFKAVGLRNIADRPPYMHTGAFKDLRQVVEFYNRGGDEERPSKSPLITPLRLTENEIDDLIDFLRSLSGTPEPITYPILPR